MPSRHGICWCLGGSRPPEIKCVDYNSPPKPIALDIPMPTDENELNAKFEELVAELDLDKQHRDALYSLPPEKKWQIYCSKKRDDDPSTQTWPDYYVERISTMSALYLGFNDEEINLRIKLVDNLKTALRTQPMSFVVRFVEKNGLQCLLDYLCKMDYQLSESPVHTSVIGCIKALMNNSHGRSHVLAHPNSINTIAQSLSVENVKTKIAVLEILGAVCLVPGGHRKVLAAMLHFQKYASERTRFQTLIYDLDRSTGKYREEVGLKTAVMSFINAALKYGPGQDHLEFRLHLRFEFLMLGIQPILDKLRDHGNSTLDRHIDFFEMVRTEDEKELAKKFDGVQVDTKSASQMFEILRKKLALSAAYPHLQSVLQHLLLLPYGKHDWVSLWTIIDQVVHQIVLQTNGQDPDVAPMEINLKKVVHQLASENDVKSYQQKLREVEKSNDELNAKLEKKERECEVRLQEKEELTSTMNLMKTKLEKEIANHAETRKQLDDLINSFHEAKIQLETERGEKQKLQHLVKTGSLPDDAKMGISNAAASLISVDIGRGISNGSVLPPAAPPAPPPPPPGMAPPPPGAPPLIGGSSLGKVPGSAMKKKNCPKPSNPLKSFNWTKLPENKIAGTIWTDLDDTRIYPLLDLAEFEQTFSAYQRRESPEDDHMNFKPKNKELTVIDGRRAQNCNILLSKLKMTNEELARAVMSMDSGEDLPKDMVEQLLKFVPTPEETQLLSEHAQDIENMARADRFLFEMGKIVHYEQRLKALYFKKKFQDRRTDCKQRIDGVFGASKQMFRSRKLKKLLELVLALGNYMNRGQRGNAIAFKMVSLNKIIDTKSSINKNMTLLHYMVTVVEKKFTEVLKLDEDLSHAKDAAKVNFTELDKEINNLKNGLKNIEKEMEFFRKQHYDPKDKFVSVMGDFCTVAAYNFLEVEETYADMKQKYETMLKAFGEEPAVQPDEFFGIFDTFLTSFSDARLENEKMRKQKEEEEKRAKMEEKLKKEREKRLMLKRGGMSTEKKDGKITVVSVENGEKGEFDDLISALRTGDVFGEDLAKMKRRRRAASSTTMDRERVGHINGMK
ncbi:disheveled-associated activator of morphogenesis 2-like [Gigantopelta aegis]|uniref:disheveled-associated activator of morphogenesis 2-like n=1 Tax=Gigantopelta aegis TaxID=1735272 RepID=UPI001B88CDBC|nr:disheveled-associated activator of morphogenesis 2-like [Gigantopelta aegis]